MKRTCYERLSALSDKSVNPDKLALMAMAGIEANDNDKRCSDAVRERRQLEIFRELTELVAIDSEYCVPESLLLSILEQKLQYLQEATSIAQIADICRYQFPKYVGGKLSNGHPYPILEEEAVAWMIAILKHPPGREQVERYEEVLRIVSKKHRDDPAIGRWVEALDNLDNF